MFMRKSGIPLRQKEISAMREALVTESALNISDLSGKRKRKICTRKIPVNTRVFGPVQVMNKTHAAIEIRLNRHNPKPLKHIRPGDRPRRALTLHSLPEKSVSQRRIAQTLPGLPLHPSLRGSVESWTRATAATSEEDRLRKSIHVGHTARYLTNRIQPHRAGSGAFTNTCNDGSAGKWPGPSLLNWLNPQYIVP